MAKFKGTKKAKSGRKMGLEFFGFEEVISRLSKLDGDIKGTTEKALKQSQKHITENLHKEMKKHKQTGYTEKSLVENPSVEWTGTVAKIDVGFDISNGGLPSIFLMYGTPRMEKDQNLFRALYGSRTMKEIRKIQEDTFYDEIRRLNG